MDALIALSTIIYLSWPLILIFGIREWSDTRLTLRERFFKGMRQIFTAWIVWGLILGFIYWQGSRPIVLFPVIVDHMLFGLLGVISGGISLTGLLINRHNRRNQLTGSRALEDLMSLSPEAFEQLVAELFEVYGHRAEVAGGSSDHGVDVLVYSDQGEKWVVQCKRYAGSVGEPVVRDLFGTLQHEQAQRAYLVTTGSFTTQAQAWAEGKPIVLYDGEQLVKLIRRTARLKR